MGTEQNRGGIKIPDKDVEDFVSSSEKIGVLGSPSSTNSLLVDLLASAVDKKLVGELAFMAFNQNNARHYAMGQIAEVELHNTWLEESAMRSIARQRGAVNPISGTQDTHLAQMGISAVFCSKSEGYEPSILGTVPPTGTSIQVVTDELLDELLQFCKDELVYLGNVYGSTPKLPLWFRHFGDGPGGASEAYHLGVFGKTGSGKSVLAKMILLAYARHADMGIIVIDPQGEFSSEARGVVKGAFRLNVRDLLLGMGRQVVPISISDCILDRWDLFHEILSESPFFDKLTVSKGANRERACDVLEDELKKKSIKLIQLYERASFEKAWEILSNSEIQELIYYSGGPLKRFQKMVTDADVDSMYGIWHPIARLFTDEDRPQAKWINSLLSQALDIEGDSDKKSIVFIDISKEASRGVFWNENIQALMINRILDGLMRRASKKYEENKLLNTLVMFDEAHRYAPRGEEESKYKQRTRHLLRDAIRTTRKYGLGWMFISQTLASLDQHIIDQLRIYFFGYGLAVGSEFEKLRDIAGADKSSLKLYQSFQDPHSSFSAATRKYSFMTQGPVSPLSFSGAPLFFTAFNDPQQFESANNFTKEEGDTPDNDNDNAPDVDPDDDLLIV